MLCGIYIYMHRISQEQLRKCIPTCIIALWYLYLHAQNFTGTIKIRKCIPIIALWYLYLHAQEQDKKMYI